MIMIALTAPKIAAVDRKGTNLHPNGVLKLITGPQGPIVQVAARLRLLQESASVEDSIVTLKPEMPVNLPMQLRARPVSDKSRLAIACGAD